MGDSLLSLLTEEQGRWAEANGREARKALAEFRVATEAAGCRLPSLGVDTQTVTGSVVVMLGGAPPDEVRRLTRYVLAGVAALAAEEETAPADDDPAPGSVSLMWTPYDGQLVVDCGTDRPGLFRGADSDRWRLAPVVHDSGPDWLADPFKVRPGEPKDRARAETALINANRKRWVS
ncbi:hypothetical protein [Kitasatospora sp. NPDC094011]|uniref:hypothetical protein n=1 Tax=Kitasatospora sp. NPDC094011 TaxID=3364090 RepID=UPI0037FAED22